TRVPGESRTIFHDWSQNRTRAVALPSAFELAILTLPRSNVRSRSNSLDSLRLRAVSRTGVAERASKSASDFTVTAPFLETNVPPGRLTSMSPTKRSSLSGRVRNWLPLAGRAQKVAAGELDLATATRGPGCAEAADAARTPRATPNRRAGRASMRPPRLNRAYLCILPAPTIRRSAESESFRSACRPCGACWLPATGGRRPSVRAGRGRQ